MTGAGYGLIETMRARDGRLPLLEAHLARLRRSLGALGLAAPPQNLAALARAAAGAGHRVVRLEVRAGVPAVTTRAVPPGAPPAVIVAVEPHAPYLHKSSEREVFDRALAEARRAGADDALLVTPAGYVAEGTMWTLFWWEEGGGRGDRLCTPSLDLGILPGVGRARVIELAPVEEVQVRVPELAGRSFFLVNAVRGIVPISAFRGRDVPLDARTAELSRRFWPD